MTTTPNTTTDRELLTTYLAAGDHSHDAFRTLTTRYVGLIYSTARRQAPPHLAEDITQAVFLLLAQRAHTLRNPQLLPAWLLKITRYCAANARRADQRRKHHEQKAAAMQPAVAAATPDAPNLEPHFDAALDALSPPDKTALLLRFYNDQPFSVIALSLQTSEDAAKKRVTRALEKLRKILARQSLPIAAPILATTLAGTIARQASAAPPALAAKIITATSTASAASASSVVIAKGAMNMMHFATAKSIAAAALALILITASAAAFMPRRPAPPPAEPLTPIVAPAPSIAPASQPDVQLTEEQYLQRGADAREISLAILTYASRQTKQLPADLGLLLSTIRAKTLPQKAAVFISPADPNPPPIPDAPDADWVNQHTSFVYLGLPTLKLRSLKKTETIAILHEKFDLAIDGKIAVAFLDGHCEMLNLPTAHKVIDQSKETLQVAADLTP